MAILNLNVAKRIRFSYAPLRRLLVVAAAACVAGSCVLRSLISLSRCAHTGFCFFLGFSGARSVTVRYEELLRLWLLGLIGLLLLLLEAAIGFVPAADISCGGFRWVLRGYWTPCLRLWGVCGSVQLCVCMCAPMAIMAIAAAVDASTAEVSCGCIHAGCWLMILQQINDGNNSTLCIHSRKLLP